MRFAIVSSIVAAFTFLPQLLTWNVIYGDFLRSGYSYGEDRFNWLSPRLVEVLFSAGRGLFVWHPVFLLGIAGLALLYHRDRRMTVLGYLGFAMQWFSQLGKLDARRRLWWAHVYRMYADLCARTGVPDRICGCASILAGSTGHSGPATALELSAVYRISVLSRHSRKGSRLVRSESWPNSQAVRPAAPTLTAPARR